MEGKKLYIFYGKNGKKNGRKHKNKNESSLIYPNTSRQNQSSNKGNQFAQRQRGACQCQTAGRGQNKIE
jgi:hypothetical protein